MKLDMRHSSRKAWSLIKKLTGNPTSSKDQVNVTANEIARQLLLNAGIAPPQVRRETLAMAERSRQCDDPRHPLHQHAPPVQSTQPLTASKIATKEAKWEQRVAANESQPGTQKKNSLQVRT
ncbi:hypothetical protein JTB14_019419 [Gonioctena quinquepunctata]|nr:hypothetical protein JTB14_019419 [Gonioctena quinquepunctata]